MAWSYHGHLHVPHFHFFSLPEEVKHFYYFALIRTILFATGGLFLPIYIYSATNSLFLTFLYLFFVLGPVRILTKPLELFMLKRYGVEFSMFLSIVLAGLTFLLVYYLPINVITVSVLGLLFGLSTGIYWNSFHVSFGLYGKFREVGEEMGGLVVLQNVLSVLLPPASAVFVAFLGYHTFYLTVFVFTALASLALIRSLKKTYAVDISFIKALKAPLRRMHIAEGLIYGFLNSSDIFIYIVLGGAVLLFGFVKLIVNLLSALASYIVGYIFDRKLPLGLGRLLYLLEGLNGIIVGLLPNPVTVTVGDILKWAGAAFHTALAGTVYIIAKNGYPEVVISRSIYITLGKSFALTLLLLGTLYIETELLFRIGFILAFLSSLLAMHLYKDLENLSAKYVKERVRST